MTRQRGGARASLPECASIAPSKTARSFTPHALAWRGKVLLARNVRPSSLGGQAGASRGTQFPSRLRLFKCASTSRASVEGQGPPCPIVRPWFLGGHAGACPSRLRLPSPDHSTLPATRKPRSIKWETGLSRFRSEALIADSVLENLPPSTNRNVASAKSVHSSTFPPMSKAP